MFSDPNGIRGESYLAQRNFDAARIAFEAVLVQSPAHVMAHLRLSTLATLQGRYRDALSHVLKIAATRPQDPDLLALLAGMLHRMGESRAALDCIANPAFDQSIDQRLLEEMASIASQLDDMSRANALLDRADARSGATHQSLYLRATLQLFEGALIQAEETLERCIAASPGNAQAYWMLSRLRKQCPERNHVVHLQGLLKRCSQDSERAQLSFALAKELEDLQRYDEAWNALIQGCQNKRRQLGYRSADDAIAFERLRTLCTADFLHEQAAPLSGPTPIFIVGMPRTGTTLLERLLGRHACVQNVGELDDFPLQLRWCCDHFSKSFLDAEIFRKAATINYSELGQRYLKHSQWRASNKAFFTDKMPLNFLNIGFIHKALPQARILHMIKSPMDTCWSNLKELFTTAYPYSYDLNELADYYCRYRELMAHWHKVLPGRILDVSYEQLVANPIAVSKTIFAFCGLDWNESCVEIEKNTMPVTTASSAQVRQPIHNRAIEQWKHYRQPLEPVRARLEAEGYI